MANDGYELDIEQQGAEPVISLLNQIKAAVNGFDGSKPITVVKQEEIAKMEALNRSIYQYSEALRNAQMNFTPNINVGSFKAQLRDIEQQAKDMATKLKGTGFDRLGSGAYRTVKQYGSLADDVVKNQGKTQFPQTVEEIRNWSHEDYLKTKLFDNGKSGKDIARAVNFDMRTKASKEFASEYEMRRQQFQAEQQARAAAAARRAEEMRAAPASEPEAAPTPAPEENPIPTPANAKEKHYGFSPKSMAFAFQAGVGTGNAYNNYQAQNYNTMGNFNPFSMSSYLQMPISMAQNRNSMTGQMGNGIMGVGSSLLMSGNPIAMGIGGAGMLAGGGMSLFSSYKGIGLAQKQAATQIFTTLAEGALKGLQWVAKTVSDTISSIFNALTRIAGIGLGVLTSITAAGIGAGVGVVKSVYGQDVRLSNESYTGISLRDRMRNEQMEDSLLLGRGFFQNAVPGMNDRIYNFATQGETGNLVPSALLGVMQQAYMGGGGVEGMTNIAKQMNKSIDGGADGKQIAALLRGAGLGDIVTLAGQMRDPNNGQAQFSYGNSYNAENDFQKTKRTMNSFNTTFEYVMKDIGNTLMNKTIPFVEMTGTEIAHSVLNLLGSIPAALQGDTDALKNNFGFALNKVVTTLSKLADAGLGKIGIVGNPVAGIGGWLKGLGGVTMTALGTREGGLYDYSSGQRVLQSDGAQKDAWSDVWKYLIDGAKTAFEKIGGILSNAFNNLGPIISSAIEIISPSIRKLLKDGLPAAFTVGFINLTVSIRKMLDGAMEGFDGSGLIRDIKQLLSNALWAIEPVFVALVNIASEIIGQIGEGLENMKNNLLGGYHLNILTGKQALTQSAEKSALFEAMDKVVNVPRGGFINGYYTNQPAKDVVNNMESTIFDPMFNEKKMSSYSSINMSERSMLSGFHQRAKDTLEQFGGSLKPDELNGFQNLYKSIVLSGMNTANSADLTRSTDWKKASDAFITLLSSPTAGQDAIKKIREELNLPDPQTNFTPGAAMPANVRAPDWTWLEAILKEFGKTLVDFNPQTTVELRQSDGTNQTAALTKEQENVYSAYYYPSTFFNH